MRVVSNSAKETMLLGEKISRYLTEGDVVLLMGPLGAGKTVFIKGILKGFGFKEKDVISPSFMIKREYKKKGLKIYHIDLYRVEKKEELLNLGYEDYFYSPEGISLIEWGGRVEKIISKYIKVIINFKGFQERSIVITTRGYHRDKFRTFLMRG